MPVKYEIVAKTGSYTDSAGEEKARWTKCGVILKTDKGLSMKLDAVPVGDWNGWFSLFPPKEYKKEPQGKPGRDEQAVQKQVTAEFDDDIPF